MEIPSMIGQVKTQLSILDSAFNRRRNHSRSNELLEKINKFVKWEPLVEICQEVFTKSNRGRPTVPVIFSLRCLFLQYLYRLSDPGLEDALADRLSFQRFLGIGFDENIPDFSTIWRFRERLVKAGLFDRLFGMIVQQLEERSVILKKGTLIDATLVQSARRSGRKKEKNGEDQGNNHKKAQRDEDATHTKKGNKHYYGYKGHIGVDEGSGVIRKKQFTTASEHDSQETDALVSGDEKSVFGDKAYSDSNRKRQMRKDGIYYGILDKGKRNHTLSTRQIKRNTQKSRVRNAVERPFAHFKNLYHYRRVRYVNLERNDLHFTFLCMIHNIRRGIALSCA
jgi:IS5 family transposase